MPAEGLPRGGVVIVRHGETEWSQSGRHTSRTDLPLLPAGRHQAEHLAEILHPDDFGTVLSSPMRRARETCQLAGFGERAEIWEDLREWDYGEYEGLTTAQIREQRPDWFLWRDGCPRGESPAEVGARADSVLDLVSPSRPPGQSDGDAKPAILFAHGHILRVLAARWIELDVEGGSRLVLKAGALGVLGHEREVRVLDGWNVRELD
jgi:broad specificity phosphatase PhoE